MHLRGQEWGYWLLSAWVVQRKERAVLSYISDRWLIIPLSWLSFITFEHIIVSLLFLWFNGCRPISFELLKILSNEPICIFHGIEFHLILISGQWVFSLLAPWGCLYGNTWGPGRTTSFFDREHGVFVQLDRVFVRFLLIKCLAANFCVYFRSFTIIGIMIYPCIWRFVMYF